MPRTSAVPKWRFHVRMVTVVFQVVLVSKQCNCGLTEAVHQAAHGVNGQILTRIATVGCWNAVDRGPALFLGRAVLLGSGFRPNG